MSRNLHLLLTAPFTLQEVKNCLTKKVKATGPDDIHNSMSTNLSEINIVSVQHLFNTFKHFPKKKIRPGDMEIRNYVSAVKSKQGLGKPKLVQFGLFDLLSVWGLGG